MSDQSNKLDLILTALGRLSDGLTSVQTEFSEFRTEMRAEVTGLHAEVAGLRTEVTGLHSEVSDLHSEVSDLRGDLYRQFDLLRREIDDLRKQVDDLRIKFDILGGDFVTLRSDVDRLTANLDRLRIDVMARIDRLQDKYAEQQDNATVLLDLLVMNQRISEHAQAEARIALDGYGHASLTMANLIRQVRRLQDEVRELKGDK